MSAAISRAKRSRPNARRARADAPGRSAAPARRGGRRRTPRGGPPRTSTAGHAVDDRLERAARPRATTGGRRPGPRPARSRSPPRRAASPPQRRGTSPETSSCCEPEKLHFRSAGARLEPSRSGPWPTILSGMPASLAASMATSMPLVGDQRRHDQDVVLRRHARQACKTRCPPEDTRRPTRDYSIGGSGPQHTVN